MAHSTTTVNPTREVTSMSCYRRPSRHRRLCTTAVVAVALLGGGVACAPGTENGPGEPGSPPPATVEQPATTPGAGGVTTAQAADLCTRIEAQLQSWRTYTPSLGRGGLNILVGEWAATHGVDLVALAGDRGRIDTITSQQCPATRDGALSALEIPDLASGLVGY